QPEVVRFAGVENFFDDFAELIDFDRKNASILALITELLDRIAEGLIDRFDAVADDVLKTNQQRKFQSAASCFLDDVDELDTGAGFLQGSGNDASGVVDVEVFRAPTLDVIKISRRGDIPGVRPDSRNIHDNASIPT